MKREPDVIYIYDGTFEGFLSCVFEAFLKKEAPSLISKQNAIQLSVGAEVKEIATDPEKADRVCEGIRKKPGLKALTAAYHATLSNEEDAEAAALRYIKLGFEIGKNIYGALTDSRVIRMREISFAVKREAGRFLEFLRFSELDGNILFGEFEPEPNVLPLIMPHFADRLKTQPFIIHDKGRRLAGVYNTKEWSLVSSVGMTLPDISENEKEYRKLWKLFFNSIAVKERINPKLQTQLLPKKYRKYMTEFDTL
ncbi:MAG: TIGR03915 family putative DNA repair protein [Oscillospiraceae bacterium]|nr:TIGR03915 family putative DNA repair protein [Oscillospiraceae bacterium]